MDFAASITADLQEFIDFFKIKYKYDHRGILKRLRLKSGLNKQLNEEVWYNLFVEKSAINYCAKFLIIKLWEDNGKIPCKINREGLNKWESFVSDISMFYNKLYDLTELDISNYEELKDVFRITDYDIFKIDNELGSFIIERLKEYDFSNADSEIVRQIFNSIYTDEKKFNLNLQYFYKPAKAIEFILSMNNQKENLI